MAQVKGANPKDTHPRRGKVNEVRQQWAVYEDGVMAHDIQEDEFSYKYGLNRYNRRTARGDVPVAKLVHGEEEERIQKERMLHLEQQKEVADRDAEVAKRIQEEEQRRLQSEHLNRVARANTDALVARRAYEEEQRRIMVEQDRRRRPPSPDGIDEDAVVAGQYQREFSYEQDAELMRQEMEDENIARQLQEKERKKYERRVKERELAKERKRLEKEQTRLQENVMAGCRRENGGGAAVNQAMGDMNLNEAEKVLRKDGKVEDAGDFSDFYIKPSGRMAPEEQRELQELQDEELARLLQDQEHKRGAKAINKDKQRHIEQTDAQLARVIYQQDKLKAKKKHRHPHGRQTSEPADGPQGYEQQGPEPHLHGRSHSMPEGDHHYQNRLNERVAGGNLPAVSEGRPPRQYDASHYQERPLPATPREDDEPQLVGRVRVDPEPQSPAPPGYRDPPSYPSSSPDADAYRRSNGSQVAPPATGRNMFAAIDPTYNQDRDPMMDPPQPRMESQIPVQSSPPHRTPPTENRPQQPPALSPPPEATGAIGGEDGYCDLDEVGPVQGQRRSTLTRGGKKGSKKSSCKQQ